MPQKTATFLTTIPELGFLPSGTVRIPELQNVRLTRRIQAIVDHPAFQRLRRVRQLGPTHLVYPGATHSRFEHSLGVYANTQRYVLNLLQTPAFEASVTEADIHAIMLTGLLHDLGHYPFAHNLEALHLKGRDTPRHEDVGGRIIRGEIPSLQGHRSVGDIIQQEFHVDPERVIALSTGRGLNGQMDHVLRSVISSAIDADKMDYLERDSIHLGVPYGRNYDRERLLNALTLNEREDRIALHAKGKVSAEIFIFGRYTMFSEAYWHHTVRAASAMMEAALAAFHSRSDLDGDQLLDVLLAHSDDEFLGWLSRTSPAASATRYLIDPLHGNQRRLHKRVATYSRVYNEADKRKAYEKIYAMEASDLYDQANRLRVKLSGLVGRPLHPADIIIDTPPRDKDRLETVDVVYPHARGVRQYALHELSRVVAGVQDDFMMVVKKIRLFAEPRLAAELEKHPDVDELILSEILRR